MQHDILYSDVESGWARISIWYSAQKSAWCAGCVWIVISCLFQGAVYVLAQNASRSQAVAQENQPVQKAEFVLVREFEAAESELEETVYSKEIETEPQISAAAPPAKHEVQPATDSKPIASRAIAKTAPPPPPQKASEAPAEQAFRDMGVMGSVDASVVGTGGGTFAVSVGNSGVGGAIGTGGRMNGPISLSNVKRDAPEEDFAPPKKKRRIKVASIRDLSISARPDVTHNRKLKARYPKNLRQESIAGEVLAMLVVLSDGTVGKVTVLNSSHEAFSESAREVLKRFRFAPARDKDGKAVSSQIRITYRFTLES